MAEPAAAQDRADAAASSEPYPPEGDLEIDRQRAGELIAVLLLDCPDVLALLRWLTPMVLTALGPALEEVQAIRRAHGLRPARTGPPALRVVGAEKPELHPGSISWWVAVNPRARELRAIAAVADWLAPYGNLHRLRGWRGRSGRQSFSRLWRGVLAELPAARAKLPG